MRLRNVSNAKEIMDSSKYIVKDPENYKGKYKEIFGNNNPIKIEIGMGKGNFIYNNALKYPEVNFIGIEKFDSVIAKAIQKIEDEEELPNLRLIRMDALDIDKVFEKELETVYLNFSDPWPKNRHWIRRLTSVVFLEKYENIFYGQKEIIQKTDNRKLFEYSIKSFNNYGYKIEEISLDLYNDEDYLKENIPTEYEVKFANKGDRIYMVKVYRQ